MTTLDDLHAVDADELDAISGGSDDWCGYARWVLEYLEALGYHPPGCD